MEGKICLYHLLKNVKQGRSSLRVTVFVDHSQLYNDNRQQNANNHEGPSEIIRSITERGKACDECCNNSQYSNALKNRCFFHLNRSLPNLITTIGNLIFSPPRKHGRIKKTPYIQNHRTTLTIRRWSH